MDLCLQKEEYVVVSHWITILLAMLVFKSTPRPTHTSTHTLYISTFHLFFWFGYLLPWCGVFPLVFFFFGLPYIQKKKTYKILEYEGFFLKGVVGGRGLIYINIYSNMSTKRIHTVIRYLNKFSILCVSLSLGLTIW